MCFPWAGWLYQWVREAPVTLFCLEMEVICLFLEWPWWLALSRNLFIWCQLFRVVYNIFWLLIWKVLFLSCNFCILSFLLIILPRGLFYWPSQRARFWMCCFLSTGYLSLVSMIAAFIFVSFLWFTEYNLFFFKAS